MTTDKKKLRIVFMGTPEFAVTILDGLVKADYNIVGVITAPDRPAGRGRKLRTSAVKEYALKHDLTILQPTNLKSEAFIETLEALKANLQVVVAFRMLPKVVWQMPEHGTFNLHASLLPNYRGAAPINWAVINGESKTGVTTFFIDEKIDTGHIIESAEIDILPDETAGELHDKLMHLGKDLVLITVDKIEKGDASTYPQPEIENIRTAYKIHKETCKIDWNTDIDTIYNLIRGLSPYPGAWCELNNPEQVGTLKIYKVEKRLQDHNKKVGSILIENKEIVIAVENGLIVLQNLQLPGKKRMNAIDLLNGFEFHKNAFVS
ncbi:methionyl-tRNA formyltransferase [Spongiivirga citrea]|uniref:Methionyl-tRNA formyltransferase n=1 Tax=Spongiivirga citrea TaxID=1481457 RepID=A0A6M0CIW1_9FLAO|nr:methionyl-tRNA formyltransferase [Spongiivirga citrea]NER17462.1 methionyl-tRNA formyltransferase [Spongiivirga citrea]